MLKFCKHCILNDISHNIKILRTVHNAKQKDQPLISCKRNEYNFYAKQPAVNKFVANKLASKGWHNNKSKGDYFILRVADEAILLDNSVKFSCFGLDNQLVSNIELQGIQQPTLIQSKAIPLLLSKKNAIIAAETGCGKTLAYLLPVIQQIIEDNTRGDRFNSPTCLILTPSRELAYQIEYVAKSLLNDLDISTEVIVGGGTKKKMLNPHFKKIDLLIATLGSLSKLTTTGIFRMSQVRHVVLDEADTLLDESFSEKLSHFLKRFPFYYSENLQENFIGTQLTLVSATMPTSLPPSLSNIVVPESLIQITTDQLHKILPNVSQRFLRLGKTARALQLLQMMKNDPKENPVIIFSNTSNTCDWISMFLNENGVNCINLNGDMSLKLRKNKFLDFQQGQVNVISCTDVGSRGLDTTRVKHVINFDFPRCIADYIHRCGRTGRIGSPQNCHVTNFITGYEEIKLVQKIEMSVRQQESLPFINGNLHWKYNK